MVRGHRIDEYAVYYDDQCTALILQKKMNRRCDILSVMSF